MLEILTTMSDEDRDYPLIRNEDTLQRRAWIDRALAGVRGRLKPDELGGEVPMATEPAAAEPPGSPGAGPVGDSGRAKLYLVRSCD